MPISDICPILVVLLEPGVIWVDIVCGSQKISWWPVQRPGQIVDEWGKRAARATVPGKTPHSGNVTLRIWLERERERTGVF
jgi:hypothetical protein